MGHKIKECRERFCISLLELSRLSGISSTYLWKIEAGYIQNIPLSTIRKIADALGVTFDTLFFA